MWWFLLDLTWPSTAEGRLVNALLFTLWGIGSAVAVSHWLRIMRERAVLDSVPVGHLEDGENHDNTPPDTLAGLFERLRLNSVDAWRNPQTALGQRVRDLWHVRGVGRSGVEALAEIFSAREAMGLESLRYTTSILVLLGLAGTIWGLHGLLGGLTGAADRSDYRGIVAALQPMKTAFSCTFVGILTSVALAGLLGYVERRQNDFVTGLEELVTVLVIPLVFPASETRQLEQMQGVLARSGDFVRQFGEAVARGQDLFSARLTEAMTAAAGAFAAGLKEAGTGLEASLGTVASQVETTINNLGESLDSMRQAARALGENAQNLLEYREELKRDRIDIQELLRETTSSVLAVAQCALAPLQQSSEQIEKAASAMEGVKNELIEESRQREAMIQAFVQQAGQAREDRRADISAFEDGAERELTTMQAVRQSMEAAISSHAAVAGKFEELSAAVRPEALRLPNGQMLGDRLVEIAAGLDALVERLRAAEDQRLSGRLGEIVTTLGQVAAGLATTSPLISGAAETGMQLVALQRNALAVLHDVQHRMNQPIWSRLLSNGQFAPGEAA
jgi:hypothetical protein